MKNVFCILIALGFLAFSCEDETKPEDPIYEFIAFKGAPTVNLNEFQNSETPVPIVLELRAFKPYDEDIDIGFEITGNNAEEGVDFSVSPENSVKIRAGKLVSDTIFVTTIDNTTGTTDARSFSIRIASVSKSDINIGLGIAEPRNREVTVNILDDECTETIDIFNTSLLNTLNAGDPIKPAQGLLTGNALKVTGDLIDYGAFSGASITITLTPESEGATKGTATFGEQEAGTDSDGYEYKFIQTGEGTYDVCSGVVNVAYDIYYMDGGSWVYWYSVTNEFAPE